MSPGIKSPSDLFSFSHVRNATRLTDARLGALRTASTSTRGVTGTVSEQVSGWQPAVTDERCSDAVEPHPRIGIGLPMSNIYATYFGGSLELVSLDGYGEWIVMVARRAFCGVGLSETPSGTDVFVRLPKLVSNLTGLFRTFLRKGTNCAQLGHQP